MHNRQTEPASLHRVDNSPVRIPRRLRANRIVLIATSLASLAACTTTSAVNLQPARVSVVRPVEGTLRVEATGSPRRAGIGSRAIASDALAAAVRGALLESNACAGIADSGPADQILRVEVASLETTEPGLDMEAELEMRWTLLDTAGQVARWQELVRTTAKTNTFDADTFEARGRMAVELAVRRNIEQGLAGLTRGGDLTPAPSAP